MKFRKFAPALAAALPLAAAAQSVTLYGVIDTGVEYLNHVGPAGHTLVRQPSLAATVPSRWGLRGSEDLGNGLKSVFVLESGFAPDSGVSNQGARLFGRQAFVGLSGPWGQVGFGRQYTMLFWARLDTDILTSNVYGVGSIDSYIPNTRADNALSYKGKFGGVTVGATYSLGRDAVNAGPGPAGTNCAGENSADARACREWSAMLMYETGWWGVSAAYDSLRGGPGAFGGLSRSSLKDDRLSLGGYMLLQRTKLGLGLLSRNNQASATPRSDLWFAGASHDFTPAFNLAGELYYLRYRHSANRAWLGALRATYAFSKRTSLYATAGYIDNRGQSALSVSGGSPGGNPTPGGNQAGVMLGIKQIF
ncbi:porin [Cupriavidus sp. MP-37]|uniref:porin n=1 Tax=Cupriavidus sp. MP-37 TaxID=2884455 RepID=UPI001D0A6B84|nr:porin [Cupriavidus sp. MP-37]UDM53949.1 porin [Cupriavidus sp. MP-37]